MSQNGTKRPKLVICEHCWSLYDLCESFYVILGNFMQFWANFDHFGQFCAICQKMHTAHIYEQKVKHGLNCQMVLENHQEKWNTI